MKFRLGPLPDDPLFDPISEGWILLREYGPLKMQLIAIPIMVAIAFLFNLGFWLSGVDTSPLTDIRNVPNAIGIVLVLAPVHELLHFICLPSFGLNDKSMFGFWPKVFSPYVFYNGVLTRNRHIFIGICPFIALSVIPLLCSYILPSIPIVIVAASYLNSFMSGMDLMGSFLLVKQVPSNTLVRNKGDKTYWKKVKESPT